MQFTIAVILAVSGLVAAKDSCGTGSHHGSNTNHNWWHKTTTRVSRLALI
jgi:hypothetical protein